MKFTKSFFSNNYQTMTLNEIQNYKGHLSEIILPDFKISPYFDFDVDSNIPEDWEKGTLSLIEKAKEDMRCLFGDDVEMAIESRSGPKKLSIHIVCTNTKKLTPIEIRKAIETHVIFNGKMNCDLDMSVYRNGISKFIVAGKPKENCDGRIPIIVQGDLEDFILTKDYPGDEQYLTQKEKIEQNGHIKENKSVGLKIKNKKIIKNKSMAKKIISLELQTLLNLISADDYDVYVKVGMFLKGNDYTVLDWGTWASKSEKYDSSEVEYKWSTFSTSSKITLKTIDFLARRNIEEYLVAFKIDELKQLFLDLSEASCAEFLAENVFQDTLKIFDTDKGDCWYYNESKQLWSISKVKALTNSVNTNLKKLLAKVSIVNSEELKTVLHSSEKQIEDLKSQQALYKKAGKVLNTLSFCNNVLGFLKGSPNLYDELFYKKFSSNKNLLAVNNGCVDLTTGVLRPRGYTDYFTNAIEFDYNPEANTSDFAGFIKEIFTHEEIKDTNSLVEYVNKALGYMSTKETKEQVMFMATGFGSNGKGVLTNCLVAVLGENVADGGSTLLDKKVLESANSASPALMALENRTLCIINEVEESLELGSVFKKIVDSGRITGRHLHGNLRTFPITHKLFVNANDVPKIPSTDNSYKRRMRIIPCKNNYKNKAECIGNDKVKDLGLETRLLSNPEGILKYLVDCAKSYYDNGGLGELPIDMEEFKKEIIAESDWSEGLEFTNNTSDTVSPKRFMAYLKSLDHLSGRTRVTGKYVHKMLELGATRDTNSVWCGVKIKDDEYDDDNLSCLSFD